MSMIFFSIADAQAGTVILINMYPCERIELREIFLEFADQPRLNLTHPFPADLVAVRNLLKGRRIFGQKPFLEDQEFLFPQSS